jgi:hypothetical protein
MRTAAAAVHIEPATASMHGIHQIDGIAQSITVFAPTADQIMPPHAPMSVP